MTRYCECSPTLALPGWHQGREAEGLKISLAGAEDKLAQIGRHPGTATVDLGLPILPPQH